MAKFHHNLVYHEDTTPKHEITNEEIQFLISLQKEMNTQDHVCQADPRFWVIQGKEKTYRVNEDIADGYYLINGDETVCESFTEFINFINRTEKKKKSGIRLQAVSYGLCKVITENDEETLFDTASINDWLQDHNYDEYELLTWCETEKTYPNTMFLTEKDAADHLRINHYHYDADAHTYAMTAWRSPRIETLVKLLQTIDFTKLSEVINHDRN